MTVKSVTIYSEKPWSNGLVKRRYQVTITDNNAIDIDYIVMPVKVLPTDDGVAVAEKLDQSLRDAETDGGLDIVPLYQTQADYDRRALGKAMQLSDVDEFYAVLPLFLAMESRGGANAVQRANYLGVPRAEYDLMADRFGDVQGISFFLDNAKGQIWGEIPAGWE